MNLPACITMEEPAPGYPVYVINHPAATARVARHGAGGAGPRFHPRGTAVGVPRALRGGLPPAVRGGGREAGAAGAPVVPGAPEKSFLIEKIKG